MVIWKNVRRALATSAVVIAVFGGGDGGTSFTTSAFASVSPAPMALSVKVNAAARSATNGTIAVEPGDVVEITANQPAIFSGASVNDTAITLRNAATAATTWTAQLVNGVAAAGNYHLTVRNGTVSTDILLAVSAGDARNGSYEVMATNGTSQKLTVNFDVKTYDMTDSANETVSGAIQADAETGTWDFVAPRGTATPTARFRATNDTLVGSFPFANFYSAPQTYSVRPFVTYRAFVTSQAALDGVYNRLGITMSDTTGESQILQMRIRGGGTIMESCSDNTIYAIESCPSASLSSFKVIPGSTAGRWTLTNMVDASNASNFSMAVIGGQNIYLSAYQSKTVANTALFRIGVPDTAFIGGIARGCNTLGTWSTATVTSSSFSSVGVTPAGSALNLSLQLNPLFGVNPHHMRMSSEGTSKYFAISSSKIVALVGARSGATAGYLQIGLYD